MNVWVKDALGPDRIEVARAEAARRLLAADLGGVAKAGGLADRDLAFILDGLELAVLDAMDEPERLDEMREAAADAFQLLRVLPRPEEPLAAGRQCLRLGCLAVLGERGADAARILREQPWPDLPLGAEGWRERVLAGIVDAWLRLIRKDGWDDLDEVQRRVVDLREAQRTHEARWLDGLGTRARRGAWELVGLYHLAKAAEILAIYTGQGEVDGGFDVREQLAGQFDRERGWVAYLVPTRALVGQVCTALRRDLGALDIVVERVSPALEVDGLEASLLTEADEVEQFRILVTTPEKLDLMLRGGWEERIGRPLTLVVVDEAHNLATRERGIKLELLLSTINKECRYAQFLLLTPFIDNAGAIARWLAPDSWQDIELGLAWQPNDRAIVLSRPVRGENGGAFQIELSTLHTSRQTLSVPDALHLGEGRPLGLRWSDVRNNASKLAAATAEDLRRRGPIIVLAGTVPRAWSLADTFRKGASQAAVGGEDVQLVQRFLRTELGADFLLPELLNHGVGVHHAGLPDDARALMEWLLVRERIQVLVATTTIAQGVNFPVSGVVLAAHQYPYGQDMPSADFWNLAGRAGRVDQGSVGIVALVAPDEAKAEALRTFVGRQVSALDSTLVAMVQEAMETGQILQLNKLFHRPEWSALLQYLVHTYRQIGDPDRFANEIERVLRGTLGFESLRRREKACPSGNRACASGWRGVGCKIALVLSQAEPMAA